MAIPASVAILATSWCHLHQLKIGPPCDTTCICSKFGPQVAPLPLVSNLAIRWRHLHLVLNSLHQPESHQFSFKKVFKLETLGPIDRTPGKPGSDKNRKTCTLCNAQCTLQYIPTGAFNESGRLKQPYFGSNLDLHSLVSSALEDVELVLDPDSRSPYSE